MVCGRLLFQVSEEKDICEITGTEGSIRFSVFNMKKITVREKRK